MDATGGGAPRGVVAPASLALGAVAKGPHSKSSEGGLKAQLEDTHLSSSDSITWVPDLIAAQAAVIPDLLAVESQEERLTYRQLERRSTGLALQLRASGVRPGVLVGLCVERSVDLVVGALGIMRAGGAYIPMDPSYPDERLSFMVKDSGARVVVAAGTHGDWVRQEGLEVVSPKVIDVDGLPADVDAHPAGGSDVAYVIYTSGSTGEPKGVEVTHANLLNLVSWHRSAFGVSSDDRATQIAGPGFDAVVWEIWPYLVSGASIHVADDLTRVTPERLRDWLVAERITLSFVPTVLAEQLITMEWPAETQLRSLLTGGDALHRFPGSSIPFTLVNNYGPTETTVVATSGVVPPIRTPESVPTIGHPIAGARVHVVDENLHPVGNGETGELLIGGAGVARGYLKRPDLTSEKFIPDHLSGLPDERLYRSGDLVRRRSDGELEFMGRVDDQVQIRGFRIEPGEIATTLNRDPRVRASVVVATDGPEGEKRLVAYVVPVEGEQLDSETLRGILGTKLPDYMVPATFVWVKELPMTPNGKIDRNALPEADGSLAPPVAPPSDANDEFENALTTMVAELLGLATVGGDENFFTLGGHSLLAAQVIARIRDQYGVEMPLRDLFDRPTVAEMAATVRRLLIADLEEMSDEEAERLANVSAGSS